jgi:hypothetical protein
MNNESDEFENYRNLDIPKNLTLKVHDFLSVNLTYPKHPLMSIMKIKSPFERLTLNSESIVFEMLFNTMKKSYALFLNSPSLKLDMNNHECAELQEFKMEMGVIYKKKIRFKVPALKEVTLNVNQNISIKSLRLNLTANLFMWIMIADQIYRQMKKEASIKHDLLNKILYTDFLKENLLKKDYETDNKYLLYENKMPDIIKMRLDLGEIECKLFTKNDNNTMKVLAKDY